MKKIQISLRQPAECELDCLGLAVGVHLRAFAGCESRVVGLAQAPIAFLW
jgi:hypothetical protein